MKLKLLLMSLIMGSWVTSGMVYAETYPAILDWSDRIVLSSPASGSVDRVNVVEGQFVKKGSLLVILSQRLFKANLVQAKSTLERELEDQAEAKRELERGKELFDRTSISVRDFKLIQIAYAKADARLRAARAALVNARLDLEYSHIRAPFDSLIIKRLVNPGQAVVSRYQAQPLIVVARANRMVARTQLSASQLSGIKRGDKAVVLINGKEVSAIVKKLGMEPVTGQKQAIYDVVVEFNRKKESHLRKGQAVKIMLP